MPVGQQTRLLAQAVLGVSKPVPNLKTAQRVVRAYEGGKSVPSLDLLLRGAAWCAASQLEGQELGKHPSHLLLRQVSL
jgi:hypothetical protein